VVVVLVLDELDAGSFDDDDDEELLVDEESLPPVLLLDEPAPSPAELEAVRDDDPRLSVL
jgi:hypothetical protein